MIGPAGFALPPEPEIRRLMQRIAPAATTTDLGGWMSRNLRLHTLGTTTSPGHDLVLRIHPAHVSARRLLALQRLRIELADRELCVALPIAYDGSTVLRCGGWVAEVEPFLPNRQLPGGRDSYAWLLHSTGRLHRASYQLSFRPSMPMHAVYASASTLARWAGRSLATVRADAEAEALARWLTSLTNRLRRRLPPATDLPGLNVHGDVKLENIRQRHNGEPVYLDFGFAAYRPRIHDLAFALTHTILTVDGAMPIDPETFAWGRVAGLIDSYQDGAGWVLTEAERLALAPYTATVRLYWAASVWAHADSPDPPANRLRRQADAMRLADWLLRHPDAIVGSRT